MAVRSIFWDMMSAQRGSGRRKISGVKDRYGSVDEMSRVGVGSTITRLARERAVVGFQRLHWTELRDTFQRELTFLLDLQGWLKENAGDPEVEALGAYGLDKPVIDQATDLYYRRHGLVPDRGMATDWVAERVARGWGPRRQDVFCGSFRDLNDTRGWPEGYADYVRQCVADGAQPFTPDWFEVSRVLGEDSHRDDIRSWEERKRVADEYVAEVVLLRARMNADGVQGVTFDEAVLGQTPYLAAMERDLEQAGIPVRRRPQRKVR